MKVFDNYLDETNFKNLYEVMNSSGFHWFYMDNKSSNDNDNDNVFNYQFVHGFYRDPKITSPCFPLIIPILEKIGITETNFSEKLIRIKANLNPPSNDLVKYAMHRDQKYFCKAAIYYVNTNNGYTTFGDERVESKANRIVFFDSNQLHAGTNSTDCKNRMVINFNYF